MVSPAQNKHVLVGLLDGFKSARTSRILEEIVTYLRVLLDCVQGGASAILVLYFKPLQCTLRVHGCELSTFVRSISAFNMKLGGSALDPDVIVDHGVSQSDLEASIPENLREVVTVRVLPKDAASDAAQSIVPGKSSAALKTLISSIEAYEGAQAGSMSSPSSRKSSSCNSLLRELLDGNPPEVQPLLSFKDLSACNRCNVVIWNDDTHELDREVSLRCASSGLRGDISSYAILHSENTTQMSVSSKIESIHERAYYRQCFQGSGSQEHYDSAFRRLLWQSLQVGSISIVGIPMRSVDSESLPSRLYGRRFYVQSYYHLLPIHSTNAATRTLVYYVRDPGVQSDSSTATPGRAVFLSDVSDGDIAPEQRTITHIIQGHGAQLFLFRLVRPILLAEVEEIVRKAQETPTLPPPHSLEALEEKRFRVSAFNDMMDRLASQGNGEMKTYKHDASNAVLSIPATLDVTSRYFPLLESETILFNDYVDSTLKNMLAPVRQLVEAAAGRTEMPQWSDLTNALDTVSAFTFRRDSTAFPHLASHAVKYTMQAYHLLWSDLLNVAHRNRDVDPQFENMAELVKGLYAELWRSIFAEYDLKQIHASDLPLRPCSIPLSPSPASVRAPAVPDRKDTVASGSSSRNAYELYALPAGRLVPVSESSSSTGRRTLLPEKRKTPAVPTAHQWNAPEVQQQVDGVATARRYGSEPHDESVYSAYWRSRTRSYKVLYGRMQKPM